ncbi:MAG: ammonia-forming cytochrome c nitrite reductase subunit c552 [Desulfonatronovibrio sp.]
MSKNIFLWLTAFSFALCLGGCTEIPEPETPEYETDLTEKEAEKNSAFEEFFPLHYQTYLDNNDDSEMTEYAGSVPHAKHLCGDLPEGYKYCQPYLKNLWTGYSFSFEYNRARGHTYALHDLLEIDRLNRYSENAGLPATCWNCKTTKLPGYHEEYGDDFWAMEFNDFREDHDVEENTVGCKQCHDPETMDLRITSIPLQEAFEKLGIDLEKATRNEMRSYVCAQCHVEYYFQEPEHGVAAKPVFPWGNGFNPPETYEYYKSVGNTSREGFQGWFIDWTHPVSDTPMLKAQHPEFEMWQDGIHGAAGVSCADCHMPYVRLDDKKKISTHHVTSPLKDIEKSCLQCHSDKSPEYLEERVIYSQERTWEQLMTAQELSVKAHEAVRLASEYDGEKNEDYDQLMIQARERIRKGQWFWDWVSAENSAGFHNPAKAIDVLAKSQQYSQQAVNLAMQAANYGIGPDLAGDIYEIVPPIKEHSRKLQMSQEHLDSHKWLEYLPKFEEAELMWDLNKKIR